MCADTLAERPLEDDDGFLVEMSIWTREIAEELAVKNDIGPLCDDHWRVMEYIKSYYEKYRQGPPVVRICKETGLSRKYVCDLFPCGVVKGAYRLAGLPRPAGCV